MSYKSYINHLSNRILIIAYIRIHSANNTSITITKGSIAKVYDKQTKISGTKK